MYGEGGVMCDKFFKYTEKNVLFYLMLTPKKQTFRMNLFVLEASSGGIILNKGCWGKYSCNLKYCIYIKLS